MPFLHPMGYRKRNGYFPSFLLYKIGMEPFLYQSNQITYYIIDKPFLPISNPNVFEIVVVEHEVLIAENSKHLQILIDRFVEQYESVESLLELAEQK